MTVDVERTEPIRSATISSWRQPPPSRDGKWLAGDIVRFRTMAETVWHFGLVGGLIEGKLLVVESLETDETEGVPQLYLRLDRTDPAECYEIEVLGRAWA